MRPENQEGSGARDPSNGRFLPGHSGNPKGRPRRGWDFRNIVHSKASSSGVTIDDAIWSVFRAMLKAANAGDVGAARLLLDRLCIDDADARSDEERAATWMDMVQEMKRRGG